MSNTPIYAPSSSPTERRSHIRQKLSAVVYLDIGTDNGGIAVDLSEEGAGVQAVGPLTELADVVLRIQLPNSQRAVETPAQIAWIGDSHRFAGMRFVGMPPEERARIQKWISSQVAPQEEVLPRPPAAERPERDERVAPHHHKDKWLSLLSESEKSQQQISNLSERSAGADSQRGDPLARETSSKSLAADSPAPPKISSGDRDHAATLSSEARPLPRAPRSAIPKLGPRVQPNAQIDANSTLAAPSQRGGGLDRLIQRPAPASSAAPTSARVPSASRPFLGVPAPRVSVVDSNRIFLPGAAVPAPSSPAADRVDRAWTWIGIVCLFAVLAALSFMVGRSVGTLARRGPLTQIPESPAVAVQNAQPAPVHLTHRQKNSEGANAAAHRGGAEQGARNLVPYHSNPAPTPQNLNQTASLRAPTTPKLQENAAVAQTQQLLNPPQTAKPSQSGPAPASFAPAQRSSATPPTMDNSAGAAPAPIIIAGRTLSPTDRFNPAHLTYRFDPDYPPAAREESVQGIVELHLVIAPNGTVQSVRLVSGPPLLVSAAVAAVKDWRYLPALLNGEPIESEQDVKIEFRLPQ